MFAPLTGIGVAIAAWLAIGAIGLARPRDLRVVRVLFPLGAAVAVAQVGIAFVALGQSPETSVLPLGLPDLPFHLRLDALSAFFLLLLGSAARRHLALLRGLFPRRRRHVRPA